jgi:hypothetical protein
MRKVLVILAALVLLTLGATWVNAQPIPNVQVYFTSEWDAYGKTAIEECPGFVIGTLYVVASNFNMWMSAVEYQVEYPPEVTWLADNTGGIDIGSSPAGIATSWPLPQNAFVPCSVNDVTVLYNCEGCPREDIPILVVPNPGAISGNVQAVRWPDGALIPAIGMLSYICPTVPAEETSWGQIKALYDN